MDDLLSMVKESFSEIYDPKRMSYGDFDETFRQLRMEAEARGEELRKVKQVGKVVSSVKKQGQVSKSGLDGGNKSGGGGSKKDVGDGDKDKDKVGSFMTNGNHKMEDDDSDKTNGKENTADNVVLDPSKLMKLRSKGVRGRGGVRKTDSIGNKSSKVAAAEPPKKATKKNRVWDDAAPKQVKLDFTDSVGENGNGNHDHVDIAAADQGESMMDKEEVFSSDDESEDDDDEARSDEKKPEAKKKGWFSSVFQRLAFLLLNFLLIYLSIISSGIKRVLQSLFSITGKANLERTDLEPALKALKERLMTKNVVCTYTVNHVLCLGLYYGFYLNLGFFHSQAEEIAEKLCESVEASLEGKKLASFTRISSTVQVLCFVLVALIESR